MINQDYFDNLKRAASTAYLKNHSLLDSVRKAASATYFNNNSMLDSIKTIVPTQIMQTANLQAYKSLATPMIDRNLFLVSSFMKNPGLDNLTKTMRDLSNMVSKMKIPFHLKTLDIPLIIPRMPNFSRLLTYDIDPKKSQRREELYEFFEKLNEIKAGLESKNLDLAKTLILKHLRMSMRHLESTEKRYLNRDSIFMDKNKIDFDQEFFASFLEVYAEMDEMTYRELMEIEGPCFFWFRQKFQESFTESYKALQEKSTNYRRVKLDPEWICQISANLPCMDLKLIEQEYRDAFNKVVYESILRVERLKTPAAGRRLSMLYMLLEGFDFEDFKGHFDRNEIRRLKECLKNANKKTGQRIIAGREIEIVPSLPGLILT